VLASESRLLRRSWLQSSIELVVVDVVAAGAAGAAAAGDAAGAGAFGFTALGTAAAAFGFAALGSAAAFDFAALGSAAFFAFGLASLGSAFFTRVRGFGLAAGDAVVSSDMDDPFFGARRTRSKDSDHIGYREFRRTYGIKPKHLT
jgi:hypothetical protein